MYKEDKKQNKIKDNFFLTGFLGRGCLWKLGNFIVKTNCCCKRLVWDLRWNIAMWLTAF